jgi:hypothetical protein
MEIITVTMRVVEMFRKVAVIVYGAIGKEISVRLTWTTMFMAEVEKKLTRKEHEAKARL